MKFIHSVAILVAAGVLGAFVGNAFTSRVPSPWADLALIGPPFISFSMTLAGLVHVRGRGDDLDNGNGPAPKIAR